MSGSDADEAADRIKMDDMDPDETLEFKSFSDELSHVGQRHQLSQKRMIQGFLYFGAKLAEEFDKGYEIDGTDVEVWDELDGDAE